MSESTSTRRMTSSYPRDGKRFDIDTPDGAARFLKNVREARENGFENLCPCCGCGIHDDSDFHDDGCTEYPEEGYSIG